MFNKHLFSNRNKNIGDEPEVYVYDKLSPKLRLQLALIVQRTFGKPGEYSRVLGNKWLLPYEAVNKFVAEEHGKVTLGNGYDRNAHDAVMDCIQNEENLEIVFDLLQTILIQAGYLSWDYRNSERVEISQEQAIYQINARLRENGVGYYFENGIFIKRDEEFIHNEVVKPALLLLKKRNFVGANAEFVNAFEKFKQGDFETAMVEATKSLESTLKTICDNQKWTYDSNATAKKLFEVVLKNNLIPNYLQNNFNNLSGLLESGATPRNKSAGHGQGAEVRVLPEYLAQFALNMTASMIILLVKAEAELP